jgi:hypothetical protein
MSIGDSLLDYFNEIDWGKYDMPTKQGHYFPITFNLKMELEQDS